MTPIFAFRSDEWTGDRLRVARESRGRDLSDLAEQTGIASANIEAIEDGNAQPCYEHKTVLADVLHYPLRFFCLGPLPEEPTQGNSLFWHTQRRWGPWSKYERDVRVPRPIAAPSCVLCEQPALSASWHDPGPFCDACAAKYDGEWERR
jgi:transcriptional regulator with XRE-family HTH domain